MSRLASSFALSIALAAVCAVVGTPALHAQTAAEGTIDLLTTPPELTSKVAPNVVLTFDDSGSMNWHHMPDQRPYTGAGWNTGNDSDQSESANRTYPSQAAPYLCAGVITPGSPAGDPRSWAMNGAYYNADAQYDPPIGPSGATFPPAVFGAAWRNGILQNRPNNPASSSTDNLSNKSFCGRTGAGYFYYDGPALTLDANGRISNTSTLYTSSNWKWQPLPASQQQNFANWYSYYRTRTMAAVTAVSRAYAPFDKGIRVAWQNINSNRLVPGTTKIFPFEDNAAIDNTRTKFYQWLFSVPASGSTPNQAAAMLAGRLFQQNTGSSDTNPYWDRTLQRELSCRKNFHIQMTDGMWNQAVESPARIDTAAVGLPDGTNYSTSALQSKIFWNEASSAQHTMADIAFNFWATDLRPDFMNNEQTKLKVRPYLADRTTGITGTTPLTPGDNWLQNQELYWNPANDPATWPHLVQFMIGFGVSGTIPNTVDNLLKLRRGTLAWPRLQGSSAPYSDTAEKIDDMWHAALNSRGQFFAASNPGELIEALQKIIASVIAQNSSSTPASVSLPILTGGNSAYLGGYDTSDWSGSFKRYQLDGAGSPANPYWDAGCLLTGDRCGDPAGSNPARDPGSRIILTSDGNGSGRAFRWDSLTDAQKMALNHRPGAAAACTRISGTDANCDGYGPVRVDYLRGKRDNENATATPQLRGRTSVLGAVINAEPAYVSSPRAGYHDMFPPGSPEAVAAQNEQDSYAGYQNRYRARRPMTYVGANDGMLHAFDAESGVESWAYVPNTLIANGRLASSTARDAGLVPGVDSKPREADVFVNGRWRTVLLGSLRLGGRGIYALDVTEPGPASESTAALGIPMWEFTSGDAPSADADPPCATGVRSCASLGYTYDSANVARIRYQNKWVALVSSGYFPSNADAAAKPTDRTEAAAKRTSLLVIDLATGTLIREIRTSTSPQAKPAGFKSFGLSTPMVYDLGSDEVDDLAYAGDLAGNLWRFDLTANDPAQWKVDLMFMTAGSGGATNQGDQPIVFNPTALRDPVTRLPIIVVGTGKYLGSDDRTSAIPEQAFYGVRDYGTASSYYPIRVNQLVTQTLAQGAGDTRSITGFVNPTGTLPAGTPPMRLSSQNASGDPIVQSVPAHGWRVRLNIATERGERAQRRALPFVSANLALLYGLIPKSDDPCDPGARYSIMVVDAATGAAFATGGGAGTGRGLVGVVKSLASPPADAMIARGGAKLIIPGLTPLLTDEVRKALDAAVPPWHRGAWRELLNW
jgi:type IV pilus assembly protein PilY1